MARKTLNSEPAPLAKIAACLAFAALFGAACADDDASNLAASTTVDGSSATASGSSTQTVASTNSSETSETANQTSSSDSAATSATLPENQLRLFVASQMADCVDVGPRTCLQTRTTGDGEWELFSSGIEGFEFEAGTSYELIVETSEVIDPPADASSIKYTLIEIVSSQKE